MGERFTRANVLVPTGAFPIVRPDHGNQHLALDDREPLVVAPMTDPTSGDVRFGRLDPVEAVDAAEIEIVDERYRPAGVGVLAAGD